MTAQVNDLMMQREVLQRANKKSKLDTKTGGRNKKWPGKLVKKMLKKEYIEIIKT